MKTKCSECGEEFKKGDWISPRFDKPKLKYHMYVDECLKQMKGGKK